LGKRDVEEMLGHADEYCLVVDAKDDREKPKKKRRWRTPATTPKDPNRPKRTIRSIMLDIRGKKAESNKS
jgi:hypothetical protein